MRFILLVFIISMLSGCITDDTVVLTKNAEDDYKHALIYKENENYAQITMFLEKFSAKYPFSKYATPAELLRLEAAYLDGQYILSETLGLRFVEAHPDHEKVAYAHYLVGMSFYQQSHNAVLDQQFSVKARDTFVKLNADFPNNAYKDEITKYLNILTNRLAESELMVGKFYFDKERYVASTNRFILIKNQYLNSGIADEALYYLAASYEKLGQTAYVMETVKLLNEKFPQSQWLDKASKL